MIAASALEVAYPQGPRVGPFDLDIHEGLTLLTGASGRGKSTVLRALAGILPAVQPAEVSGHVRVVGQDPAAVAPADRPGTVGWVPQDLTTAASTAWDEVALPMENAGWKPTEARDRVDELLARFDVDHVAHRSVATLSGGEQARVVVAAALACRPSVLLLDEPLAQLDAEGRDAFEDALTVGLADGVRTALATTHRPELWRLPHERIDLDSGPEPPVARVGPGDPGDAVVEISAARAAPRRVRAFDMAVHAGQAVALQGDNGSGKSTLLWLVAGLLEPSAGRARVLDDDPASWRPSERAARLGLSFQDPAWHVTQDSVWEEATVTLRALGRPPEEAVPWLQRFGLAPSARRHPWDLSGGERQRLAVVTAVAHDPPVALLDEPTRGMDAAHRHALIETVADRCRRGRTTLVVTHDEPLADAMPRRVRMEALR